MAPVERKRDRQCLTVKEKREICEYSKSFPSKSQQDVANFFAAKWGKPVKRRTIGDVIKQSDRWLNKSLDASMMRQVGGKHSNMEQALFLWFSSARAKTIPLTEAILRTKAMFFGGKLEIVDFHYSNGWMNRFKMRYGISCRKLCGESASVSQDLVSAGRTQAKGVLKDYQPRDVYNMDETGLFYQMLPDRSLTTGEYSRGTKKAKARISLAVCSNADGSDKSRLLVIGKSANPRCFKGFKHDLYCDYRNNKKSWMTSLVFHDWLRDFDKKMRIANRHVLMLLDNAPSHILPENEKGQVSLTNTKVHFLPPNTTSHLQPMDAGVINNFKQHYRRYQLQHLVDAIDENREPKLELSDAIRFSKMAWDEVKPETIKNCFKHTGITPDNWFDPATTSSSSTATSTTYPRNIFEQIAEHFNIDRAVLMTPEEFDHVDDHLEPTEVLTDDEIVDLVTTIHDEDTEEPDAPEEVATVPSALEARRALEQVTRYIESNRNTNEEDITAISKLRMRLNELVISVAEQKEITDFFHPVGVL